MGTNSDKMQVGDTDFDFGFTAVTKESIVQPSVYGVEQRVSKEAEKAKDMYKAIMPLLSNLQKDADKMPYIHWPDRVEKIEKFKAKLDAILRGP